MTQTLVESPAIVNGSMTAYQTLVDYATSTWIENVVSGIQSLPWEPFFNIYRKVWGDAYGIDYYQFPTPQEPVVDIPNDFDQWVAQMESDFGLAYQQQYSGIAAF